MRTRAVSRAKRSRPRVFLRATVPNEGKSEALLIALYESGRAVHKFRRPPRYINIKTARRRCYARFALTPL